MRPESEQPETTTAPVLKSALAQLRRGGPLIVQDGDRYALIRAAESVDASELLAWHSMVPVGSDTLLVTTHRRVHALGLADDPVPAGLWAIPLPMGAAPALIAALTDPTLIQTAPRPPLTAALLGPDPLPMAGINLLKQAGLLPSLMVTFLSTDAALPLAERAHLLKLDAAAILQALSTLPRQLTRVTDAHVPLADTENARIIAFRPADGGTEHLAIIIGDPPTDMPVLTRIHSECFTGDLLGSLRCDCGEQLRGAIRTMATAGGGIVLYLAQEGRGIGLINKLRAYRLQDAGFDTVDANEQLGFDPDERVYGPAAEMLRQLGYQSVRLLTNNPEKLAALPRHGITVVDRVPHQFSANTHNQHYLNTKAKRSGHLF